MKKNPRLQFTDAEIGPKLKKHVRRVDKAGDKVEKARKKIPKTEKKLKQAVLDPKTGKIKTRLYFEEVDKAKPPSKLSHAVRDAPGNTLAVQLHRQISAAEDDNAGLASAHRLEETAESGGRLIQHSRRSRKLKPYRKAAKAERRLEKANVNVLYRKHLQDNPQLASNPLSRWQQKRAIRKQYAASVKSGQTAAATMQNTAKAAKKAAEKSKGAVNFILNHKKWMGIILGLFLCVSLLLNILSSCSILAEGLLAGMSGATYPSEDADMLAAEAAYAGMEADLQSYLDSYASTHSYDEYLFDLDEIGHDPYVLISLLTAYHSGAWTLADVQGTLSMLFDRQYILTETVTTETRYGAGGRPYPWTVCSVRLENFDLSHLPAYLLDEDGMSLYASYMATLGNRPDLFPVSQYPNASQQQNYLDYDVPPEALADAQFAAMLEEAEKYLGFPYVFGGSSPSTSFDCSGFVSWVINHSGWDVGRLGAKALCNLCTPVSSANAKPGDLVFFINTYNAPDPNAPTHCGIYVGNNMMLHCGNPISYADLNSSYWQDHFFCYGRLPTP
jgi:hypothetical protein|nr:C40 family peptidase [uncultured Oscillibacter sp.]